MSYNYDRLHRVVTMGMRDPHPSPHPPLSACATHRYPNPFHEHKYERGSICNIDRRLIRVNIAFGWWAKGGGRGVLGMSLNSTIVTPSSLRRTLPLTLATPSRTPWISLPTDLLTSPSPTLAMRGCGQGNGRGCGGRRAERGEGGLTHSQMRRSPTRCHLLAGWPSQQASGRCPRHWPFCGTARGGTRPVPLEWWVGVFAVSTDDVTLVRATEACCDANDGLGCFLKLLGQIWRRSAKGSYEHTRGRAVQI